MLGFSYNPDENQAQIQSVTIGGALADAGLQAGDYIAAVDDNEIASGEALSQYFEDHPLSDQTVTLTYLRDGLDYDVEVTPQAVHYVEQGFSYNLGREKIQCSRCDQVQCPGSAVLDQQYAGRIETSDHRKTWEWTACPVRWEW